MDSHKIKEFKHKIDIAFSGLRTAGYVAEQNFACCQSCGWAEMPEDNKLNVFYHAQDNETLEEDGNFYLSWSGNGKEIVEIFEKAGLFVKWDGSDNKRIQILFENKQ